MQGNSWTRFSDVTPLNVVQGTFEVSSDPDVFMATVLGSCIAVCLYDDINRVGGMNHILLPGDTAAPQGSTRYGVHLMELLINGVLRKGGQRDSLQAKVFGGAQISKVSTDIGAKNAAFVKEFLCNEDIPCTSESTGGKNARKVQFVPTLGLARQMLIDPPSDLFDSEVRQSKPKPQTETEITLF